jgi:hypothetical protein
MITPGTTPILNEIEARLGIITTTNGYNYTVRNVDRGRVKPYKGYDLPAINFWSTTLRNEQETFEVDRRMLTVFIESRSLTRDEDFPDVSDKLFTDVMTALNRDTDNPAKTDPIDKDLGMDVDLMFREALYEIDTSKDPWCGVLIELEIQFLSDEAKYSSADWVA